MRKLERVKDREIDKQRKRCIERDREKERYRYRAWERERERHSDEERERKRKENGKRKRVSYRKDKKSPNYVKFWIMSLDKIIKMSLINKIVGKKKFHIPYKRRKYYW